MVKKRRYFDTETSDPIHGPNSVIKSESAPGLGPIANDKEETHEEQIIDDVEIIEAEDFSKSSANNTFKSFEDQLKSVLGHLDSLIVESLYKRYFKQPNNLTLAINDYLSHTYEDKALNDSNDKQRRPEVTQIEVVDDNLISSSRKWHKYIGSLNVQAWATRPTMKPLQYTEKLELKKLVTKSSKNNGLVTVRVFTVPKSDKEYSREIGRISEDITRIIAPLLDLDIAEFDTTVMLSTSKRLSIGDSFYVQIDCFLKSNAFEDISNIPDNDHNSPVKKKKKIFDGSATIENEKESILRHRQFAVSHLFECLGISPCKHEESPGDGSSVQLINDDFKSEGVANSAEDINLDHLKEIYQNNNPIHFLENLPDTTTPPKKNFNLDLRKYQRIGLGWMLVRESEIEMLEQLSKTDDGATLSSQSKSNIIMKRDSHLNPLWKKYAWPNDRSIEANKSSEEVLCSTSFFYANMYSGEMSIDKPVIKVTVKGGILADEMGLGKTISALSLINSVPYDSVDSDSIEKNYAYRSTLVVSPMSLLSQWKSEFERSNNNPNHRCLIYYGGNTESDLRALLSRNNKNVPVVVITTYGTIASEYFKRSKKGFPLGLFSLKFFRIIIDEGHIIRNRNTKIAKAVFELSLSRRWVLTGTPIINRLDDLYSLVRFLNLEPWSNISYWRTFVSLPFELNEMLQTFEVIKHILDPIFLRRTKDMKLKDGKPLIELPSKDVIIKHIKFNKYEEAVYNWFKNRASNSFKEGMKSGLLLKRYSQILTHILRLRQICCHTDLVGTLNDIEEEVDNSEDGLSESQQMKAQLKGEFKSDVESEDEVQKAMNYIYQNFKLVNSECSICTESPIQIQELSITPCCHCFCLDCILEHIDFQVSSNQTPLCPNCREPIFKSKLFKVRILNQDKVTVFKADSNIELDFQLYLYDQTKISSKIQALINFIRQENRIGEQLIVFSQFSSFLDILETEIESHLGSKVVIYKFDGRLSLKERQRILDKFSDRSVNSDKITILLLSLKAGGVGLNLTSCSTAVLMDPWWLPNVEEQAIDRIHRIGQDKNVTVVRFIVENSIESKMLKIQERKKQLGEVVIVEEDERRKRRIEEIKLLFDE
ncbi:uncharacterized protein PRCAT00001002001 [Priceomyces carsonii]|uniref:uncharacterized protein n=1 Tax=Priceomyces carsonii TaxID=28549 RepID=UPI002ED7A4D7|nr:unnamed protein product [Priceomyces carsonii]